MTCQQIQGLQKVNYKYWLRIQKNNDKVLPKNLSVTPVKNKHGWFPFSASPVSQ